MSSIFWEVACFMQICHPDLNKIYFIAIGDHENSGVDTLLETQR